MSIGFVDSQPVVSGVETPLKNVRVDDCGVSLALGPSPYSRLLSTYLSFIFLRNSRSPFLLRGLNGGTYSILAKPWAALNPLHRKLGELDTDQSSVAVYSVLS